MPTDASPTEIDQTELPCAVGRYGVVRRIGRGGFAEVYLGRDPDTGAFLALKVLREDLDSNIRDQVRSRFLAEEAIARAIDHPAVVRIRETSPRGERPCFIAMDYVDGLPFCEYFDRLRRTAPDAKRMPRFAYHAEVARLGHEIARAIAVAHARGIVHRDLKPDNVLVVVEAGTPHVRLLDFGIAKAPLELFSIDRSVAVTRYYTELGTVMGSPPYMAPEQNGSAHAVTGQADVFALGVMLLVVLLGLDARSLELGEDRIVLPAQFDDLVSGAALPDRLRALLRAMVDADPDDRPAMEEVAIVLQHAAQSDEKFAAAVEAWVRHGTVPKARALFEFARTTERALLTEDERSFLVRAPVERLRRSRVRARWSVVACAALVAAFVLATSVVSAGPRWLDALRRSEAQNPVVDRVFAASPAVDRGDAHPSEAVISDQRQLLDEQARRSEEQQTTIRTLGTQLAELKRVREQADHRLAFLEARVSGGERALGECRGEANRQGQALIECRRDVEAHLGQLAEGAERLRLCTRTLREQAERVRGRGKGNPKEKPPDKSEVEGQSPGVEPAAPPLESTRDGDGRLLD